MGWRISSERIWRKLLALWSMWDRRNTCQEALPYKDLVNKELWLVDHMISFIVIPLGSLYNVEEEKCDLIQWTWYSFLESKMKNKNNVNGSKNEVPEDLLERSMQLVYIPKCRLFAFKWSEDYSISSVVSNVKEKLVFLSQFFGDWKSMNRRQMKTQNGRDLALWEQICTCVYKSTPFHICRYIWSGWHKIHNFLHNSAFVDSLSNLEAWNLVCFQDQKRNMVTWLGKVFSNN